MPIGIIGGSGLYGLVEGRPDVVETPHGMTTVVRGRLNDNDVVFIPRHGLHHEHPPHKVNYKANIFELHRLGCQSVFSVCAAGVISRFKPGDLILARDFIAFHILETFFDSFREGMRHTDFTEPYSGELNRILVKAAKLERTPLKDGGVIFNTLGPRYETRAEIMAMARMGANLVNMTNAHEAVLAHELGLRFAGIAIGTNWACGLAKKPLSHEEVLAMMKEKENAVKRLLARAVKLVKQ
ncbi:MAG: MTAP family purine nucleoside phosphorylase [Candidatus Micrarchaeia archaeon]